MSLPRSDQSKKAQFIRLERGGRFYGNSPALDWRQSMSGQQPLEELEKKQLCQLKEANPKLSYKDLIAKAKEKFNDLED
jgi:hypothetical protein